ncbi:hypothetical protein CHLRE_03g187750v5 [Chlamydomonas reinhardtii]|uniref:Uncharacterized protein n=1 Tax=Chlamydomonas reinhardtii TaxID=3055 RepID=A0A2K3DY42_CHLRE|nr:uncharacterized protein CHLRE_03g187750v5 [Chlamydomonas reinhardtii]PNW85466.1 hypothetical protein CHLRE_03g187750v5 [Chlamydomonas reinhardtii]
MPHALASCSSSRASGRSAAAASGGARLAPRNSRHSYVNGMPAAPTHARAAAAATAAAAAAAAGSASGAEPPARKPPSSALGDSSRATSGAAAEGKVTAAAASLVSELRQLRVGQEAVQQELEAVKQELAAMRQAAAAEARLTRLQRAHELIVGVRGYNSRMSRFLAALTRGETRLDVASSCEHIARGYADELAGLTGLRFRVVSEVVEMAVEVEEGGSNRTNSCRYWLEEVV